MKWPLDELPSMILGSTQDLILLISPDRGDESKNYTFPLKRVFLLLNRIHNLGSGSDYTVFSHVLGIPSIDLYYDYKEVIAPIFNVLILNRNRCAFCE